MLNDDMQSGKIIASRSIAPKRKGYFMPEKDANLVVRIDRRTKEKLERIAKRKDDTASRIVRRLVKKYVNDYSGKIDFNA